MVNAMKERVPILFVFTCMHCREDDTDLRKTHGPRLHNCTPQVVNLSVTDGLTEFWTATDFLTADYNLKICKQQMCFHRYRTADYLYIYIFVFKSNFIIIIIIIIIFKI